MSNLTEEQLIHLQKLSNIELIWTEKDTFLQKLEPIITKLNELSNIDTSDILWDIGSDNFLRVLDWSFDWPKQKEIAQNIIKNVDHEIINNSIVIKSVLN